MLTCSRDGWPRRSPRAVEVPKEGSLSSAPEKFSEKISSFDSPSHLSLIALSSGGKLAHLRQTGRKNRTAQTSAAGEAIRWCSRGIGHHAKRALAAAQARATRNASASVQQASARLVPRGTRCCVLRYAGYVSDRTLQQWPNNEAAQHTLDYALHTKMPAVPGAIAAGLRSRKGN